MVFAAALVLAASAVALVMVYGVGERIITQGERREALAERDLLEEVAVEQGMDSAAQAVARRVRFSTGGERYALFDGAGRPLAGDIPRFDRTLRGADWRLVRMVRLDGGEGPRLHVASVSLPEGGWIVVGRDLSGLRRFERAILYGFAAALAIVAAAGFAAGLVLNGLILQRVEAIAATAERIAAGDLSARTALSDRHDPFGRVGASLNAMLERIEELMTGLRTVTDSVAHDLRSPLTRMEGALARALHPGASEPERLDAIEAAHGEAGHALATLSALLDIARAETGLSRDMMAPVDVGALVAEMAEVFAPIIEDADQALELEVQGERLVVLGYEALLRQAVGNLLHNASVHAGAGAVVVAGAHACGPGACIVVADTGVGVPADQRGRVQQRFVRLDPARSSGGSGLGLAIVAACAKLHGGVLRLEDNAPGLRAELEIGGPAA